MKNIIEYNREAWNRESQGGRSRWCDPVSAAVIEAAQKGEWEIILTPNKCVPESWFGPLKGREILCLASGGGQQAPILAASGASVTSFDVSDEQLAKDELVAEKHSLPLRAVQGDMADLSVFENESFDLIFHPVSNVFCPNVRPVWKECFRVLKYGGRLLSGFMNPMYFLFDHEDAESSGRLVVKYPLPFSDLTSLPEEKREKLRNDGAPYEFGHTLDDQIGGQLAAGFVISGFYEDDWDDEATPLNRFTPMFISTLARKLRIE